MARGRSYFFIGSEGPKGSQVRSEISEPASSYGKSSISVEQYRMIRKPRLRQKMFADLSDVQMERVLEAAHESPEDRSRILKSAPSANNLYPGGEAIRYSDIAECLDYSQGTTGNIHRSYLQMLCEYINRQARRGDSGTAPLNTPVCALRDQNFRMSTMMGSIDNDGDTFNVKLASAHMIKDGLGPDVFDDISHIFIPITTRFTFKGVTGRLQSTLHSSLLVISPKTRTVDHLDSLRYRDPHPMVMTNALRVLAEHLRESFEPSGWRIRENGSIDQAFTSMDCTYITLTNAMCIAFGYDLRYEDENMKWRRRRMALDLLYGRFSNRKSNRTDGSSPWYYGDGLGPATNKPKDGWYKIAPQFMLSLPPRSDKKARTGTSEAWTWEALKIACEDFNTSDVAASRTKRYADIDKWLSFGCSLEDLFKRIREADDLDTKRRINEARFPSVISLDSDSD